MKLIWNGRGSPANAGSTWTERWNAGVARATGAVGLCLLATGCATSNFNFDALSETSEYSRVERMGQALVEMEESGEGDSLHDVGMAPLFHTHLNVFSRAEEDGIPKGFVESDIDAYLPVFGVVDMEVHRYDENLEKYESHEYDSYLWGLFQNHREHIATPVGMRVKETRRLLWFFSWRSDPEYKAVTS
ncbi:MAG: hypothetical protein P1V35_18015 [Planctomycetota bacterium]|nr:hypothetical protein [Planctomycetota bacterium]